MYSTSLLGFLERRQLGYRAPKKILRDMFLDQFACVSQRNEYISYNLGNTFACKFSKNKNNLHVIACSTERGELVVQNTLMDDTAVKFERSSLHDNAIFDISWSEPDMKLVTACGDQTSKLCSVLPSGTITELKEFVHCSSVKSAMFCPGSSDVFCTGCQDGSIKVWDARVNNGKYELSVPNVHAYFVPPSNRRKPTKFKVFGVNATIFKDSMSVMSCSVVDADIKVWDLRKSYRLVKGKKEPLPKIKYYDHSPDFVKNFGYQDMVINSDNTYMYACSVNTTIDRFSLDGCDTDIVCRYKGNHHETCYSKISISYDGRYLFSGCTKYAGVMWLTDLPCITKPVFKMMQNTEGDHHELSASDWCADPSSLKLGVSGDSVPTVWCITPKEYYNSQLDEKISKTPSYKSKLVSYKVFSSPVIPEMRKQFEKQTAENMEAWDLAIQCPVPIVENSTANPKGPWEVLFTKTSPLSQTLPESDTTTTQSSPVLSKRIPDATTPTSSRKRKKSVVSPRNLIDQYLVPNKREKLDTVEEV